MQLKFKRTFIIKYGSNFFCNLGQMHQFFAIYYICQHVMFVYMYVKKFFLHIMSPKHAVLESGNFAFCLLLLVYDFYPKVKKAPLGVDFWMLYMSTESE